MEIETLKRSHLKRNIMIGVAAVLIISAIVLNFTRAKYRVTDSIPLIHSIINYSPGDIIITAYLDNVQLETFPEKGTVSLENITCDNNAIASFDTTNWQINVSNLTQKGTKCDVYFKEGVPAKDTILANYPTVLTRNDFSTTVTNTTTGTIYKSLNESQYDNDGEVYYFAGNPTDNWVQFGGFYWRIVRINGDGSIRLIYSGDSESGPVTTGTGTLINNGATQNFNNITSQSEYVGLKYTIGSQHGQNTDSAILNTLQLWYTSNNLNDWAEYIDTNIGFCSDRNVVSGNSWSSTDEHDYAAYGRLITNKNPSLVCSSSDIIKEPVGLITADEAAFAGEVAGQNNTRYYLYIGQAYWTMSPYFTSSSGSTYVFFIEFNGRFKGSNVTGRYGVRPVINLKADTKFIGSGTSTDPYVVEGAA